MKLSADFTPIDRYHDSAFSIVKAIGIIAIVTGHAAIRTPLMPFVYLFHIAIFFFVAGYFFDDRQIGAPRRFFIGKFRRLYLPYVLWGSLFVVLHNLFLQLHLIGSKTIAPYDTIETLHMLARVFLFNHHEQMQSPYWFLQGLFFGLTLFFIITFLSRKLAHTPAKAEYLRAGAVALLVLAGFGVARFSLGIPGEAILVRTAVITGLIYLGKLYALFRHAIPLNGYAAAGCLLALAVASWAGYRINVGARLYGTPPLLFVAITCAGCYMILTAATALAQRPNGLTRLLDYTGRHTMAIMLWHIPVFKLITLLRIACCDYPIKYLAYPMVIPQQTWLWWIPYLLVGLFVPLGCCLLYDRFRRSAQR